FARSEPTLIGSVSSSWRALVMHVTRSATLAALSHAGPISGSGPGQPDVIVSPAEVAAAPTLLCVVASLIALQTAESQSALTSHGAPAFVPPLHCGRHTVDGGSVPFDRLSSHLAIALNRAFEYLAMAFPSAFRQVASSALA